MALYLNYIESIIPYLDEILEKITIRHFDFKRQDTFRIIVPESIWIQDLEEALLKTPKAQGVIIGQSILTLNGFAQQVRLGGSHYLSPAHPVTEAKVLQKLLGEKHPQDEPPLRMTFNLLKDLQRLHHFGGKPWVQSLDSLWPQLLFKLEQKLKEKFQLESSTQAMRTSLERLELHHLKGIEEIYFLGFSYPAWELVQWIKKIHALAPEIKMLLLIPPPNWDQDTSESFHQPYQSLEKLSEQTTVFKPLAQPNFDFFSFTTPLHEAIWATKLFKKNPKATQIIFPNHAEAQTMAHQMRASLKQETISSLPAQSCLPYEWIQDMPEAFNGSETPSFQSIQSWFLQKIQEVSPGLARGQDFTTLRMLDHYWKTLKQYGQWANHAEPPSSLTAWQQELEILFEAVPATNWETEPFYRPLAQSGLRRRPHLILMSCHEKAFSASSSLLSHSPFQSFFLELKKKHFLNALFLGSQSISVSYTEFSLKGDSQAPFHLIEKGPPTVALRPCIELGQTNALKNLYLHENIQRERVRQATNVFSEDEGNLQDSQLTQQFLTRLQQRPLSPTAIDDYAKCPFRFFAKRYLGITERDETRLEMDPKSKGSMAHLILEKVLQHFKTTHFNQQKIPTWEAIQSKIELEFKQFKQDTEQPILEAIFEDEKINLKKQIISLLKKDWEDWNQSETPLLPKHLEWKFGFEKKNRFEIILEDKTTLPVVGVIDRIDYNPREDHYLIIDYKSSGSDHLARDLRAGLSFQLYLYLEAVQKKQNHLNEAVGALYWDLKGLRRDQGMAIKETLAAYGQKVRKTLSILSRRDFEERIKTLEQQLKGLLTQIVSGNYQVAPKKCLEDHCHLNQVCRYTK